MDKDKRGFWDRHFWKFAVVGLAVFTAVLWMALPPAVGEAEKPRDYAPAPMPGRSGAELPEAAPKALGEAAARADQIANAQDLRRWEGMHGMATVAFRETPPKIGRVSEGQGLTEAREGALAAQAVALVAPECVLPTVETGRKGTALEGWRLEGVRVEPRRSGCGPEQLAAAAAALAQSGLSGAKVFEMSQSLDLARARALARKAREEGAAADARAARLALDGVRERALSGEAARAWEQSRQAMRARAREGLASIESGLGDEAGRLALRSIFESDLAIDEASWRDAQLHVALAAVDKAEAALSSH